MTKRKTWLSIANEYDSKRNLRPKRSFVSISDVSRLSDELNIRKLWCKESRYYMRSVYGSKY